MTIGLQLGRPGVYEVTARRPEGFLPVRLDVTGFVGVALRGPVDTPTLVKSWSDYERRFGAFERADGGPDRLLPYAVQAFFAQGGEQAYVVRVAAPPGFEPGAARATATYVLDAGQRGLWSLTASDEGTWGDALSVLLSFTVSRTFHATLEAGSRLRLGWGGTGGGLTPPDGTLARVRRPGGPPTGELRWLSVDPDPAQQGRIVLLDRAIGDLGTATHEKDDAVDVDVDVVTGTVEIADRSSSLRREERFTGLGLRPGHPTYVGDVLRSRSVLALPTGDWSTPLLPDRFLTPLAATRTATGLDRSYGITGDSFFDDGPADADPLDELATHRGADALGRVAELGLLCAPDLGWRSERPVPSKARPPIRPVAPCDPCPTCPPVIDRTADDDTPPPPVPIGLDPSAPDDLAELVARQRRLVDIADLRRQFVVLLDVPNGLSVGRVTDWRAGFDSSHAAAYHPWLGVPRVRADPTDRSTVVAVPPSSFAAGIIAVRERRFGLAFGPANELATGAVLTVEAVDDAAHDRLHELGVNVYRSERDGVRLTAARTLSTDADYRQLSVRRFMTMLALTIERQASWLVFEPNTPGLRARLAHALTQLLREQQRRGAFSGDSEATSFFVRCDPGLNPPQTQALGRLVAEVGVALAAPLEFLVLRISQDVDGALSAADEGR